MSYWTETINYINKSTDVIRPIDVKNLTDGSTATIASFINYLHNAKYIKRIDRGEYVRLHKIPVNLTLSQLRKFIYPVGENDRNKLIDRYWKVKTLSDKINDTRRI